MTNCGKTGGTFVYLLTNNLYMLYCSYNYLIMNMEKWITVSEYAKVVGKTRDSIYKYIKSGKITSDKIKKDYVTSKVKVTLIKT